MNLNLSAIVGFLSHRNLHKLGGTAVAILGLTGLNSVAGKWEAAIGATYAAVMHLAGGIKKVADGA